MTLGWPCSSLTSGSSYKSIFQKNSLSGDLEGPKVVLAVGVVVGREGVEGANRS